jgi:uncharacterized protein (TIGR01777 family)
MTSGSQKKVLLTGGSGLIGQALGQQLHVAGYQLVVLSRSKVKAIERLPFPAQVIEWNGKNEEDLVSQFEKNGLFLEPLEAVIHLMGENIADHRWSDAIKAELVSSRVDSTRALKNAFKKRGIWPRVWLQGSAVGIYGTADLSEPANEDSNFGSGFLPDLCRDWEAAASGLPESVRFVTLRAGVVMSHKGGALTKMAAPTIQGVAGNLGTGEQGLALIHLEDVVGFIQYALENSQVRGVYNLVCDEAVSQGVLTEKLCRGLRASPGPSIPAAALKLIFGEMSQLLLDPLAVVSKRLREDGYRLKYPNVDSILSEVTSWFQHPHHAAESVFCKYEEQFIPRPIEQVFEFFSEAKNLERITPDFLHFKIQEVSTPQIEFKTQIQYQLKLHGVPFGWLTSIDAWEPPRRFVDNQVSGPYRLWYHEHSFESVPGGTLIRDWVRFQLPLGKLGNLVGYGKVRSDVDRIFAYRRSIMAKEWA